MSEETPVIEFNSREKFVKLLGFKITDKMSLEEYIDYISNLEQENKELKERIDKAMKKIDNELAYYNHLCTPKVMDVYKILEGDK